MAKEGRLPQLTDDPTWIIDPIDGTTNFVHHFPHTCISLALLVNKKAEIGIIYNPLMRQFFFARRHCGAFLNGKPIKTSDVRGKLLNALRMHFLCQKQAHIMTCLFLCKSASKNYIDVVEIYDNEYMIFAYIAITLYPC